MKKKILVDIKNLSVSIKGSTLINRASFRVFYGESVGLLGDSGAGKSVFAFFLLGLLDFRFFSVSAEFARFVSSDFSFNFLTKKNSLWNFFRANSVSLIFQDPSASLNPTVCCGKQVLEVFDNTTESPKNKTEAVFALFKEVGFLNIEKVFYSFPHELSGGQKQRVVIAIALASSPSLIVADEPTTSLDPNSQKNILDLLLKIKKSRSIGVVLISHNIDLVNYFCDRIYVFSNLSFFNNNSSVYKKYISKRRVFLKKIKNLVFKDFLNKEVLNFSCNTPSAFNGSFFFKNLSVSYLKGDLEFFALNNISLSFNELDVLGVVGGSGSGKTTLGRIISGIEKNYFSDSFFSYCNLSVYSQMVYQDPFSSFNPKYKVGDSVSEIIKTFNSNFSVSDLFKMVELDVSFINKYPHEISGGEKQRVSIARVLASNPRIIVFDESLSALDTETQYSILNLIRNINMYLKITIVFISHDIFSVSFLCNKIIVLDSGKIVDTFNSENLFKNNRSNYTKKLISDSFFYE